MKKLDGNRLRDADTDRRLLLAGWQALRIWEHEDPALAAERVRAAVRRRDPRHAAGGRAA